ncbi:unnamed protein product [Linum trigynum]|uniref:Uncharacterized protein n=1 Tax=Linum trigynum TaxID=586398 RepID=A0AAV2DQR4_9ROSI
MCPLKVSSTAAAVLRPAPDPSPPPIRIKSWNMQSCTHPTRKARIGGEPPPNLPPKPNVEPIPPRTTRTKQTRRQVEKTEG